MEDSKERDRQRILEELWEKHKHNAVTDDEGTYVNLENFSIGDYGLSMEDPRVPGNQSLSSTKNYKRGFSLSNIGGRYRLFKSM